MTQRLLQFEPAKESQAERLRRILAGDLRTLVAPASTFTFGQAAYQQATTIAQTETRHTAG